LHNKIHGDVQHRKTNTNIVSWDVKQCDRVNSERPASRSLSWRWRQ